jgi:hypothetical protein
LRVFAQIESGVAGVLLAAIAAVPIWTNLEQRVLGQFGGSFEEGRRGG